MHEFFGRTQIFSDVTEVNIGNVLQVLEDCRTTHMKNHGQIKYLYNYYRGKQPVLERIKQIREEINNKVVVNRANEIVSFKVGYLCGEPIQYISLSAEESVGKAITTLNDYMRMESKSTKDKELVEWQMICGTSYRMVLPGNPFEIYTLDPRHAFVVYSTRIGNKPLCGVYYVVDKMGTVTYYVYTADRYYEVKAGAIIKNEAHAMGMIPIIEYPANNARLGAFEIVLPLLDAINEVESNRVDGIEQFVQSLMVFYNCQLGDDENGNPITPAYIREAGAIFLKSIGQEKADLKILTEQLDQTQTQTLVDNMYQEVLDICGMPNRNGGSSTSDTGSAVIMRDGWSLAESRAKDSESMFKKSEREFLKLVLRICKDLVRLDLDLFDMDIKFTRRNYENLQTKSQVLVSMLNNDKIDPRLAFVHCGMFSDPEEAYRESAKYHDEEVNRMENSLREELNTNV